MTSFTLKIDNRTKEAKALIEYLKSLPFVQIEEEKAYSQHSRKNTSSDNRLNEPVQEYTASVSKTEAYITGNEFWDIVEEKRKRFCSENGLI